MRLTLVCCLFCSLLVCHSFLIFRWCCSPTLLYPLSSIHPENHLEGGGGGWSLRETGHACQSDLSLTSFAQLFFLLEERGFLWRGVFFSQRGGVWHAPVRICTQTQMLRALTYTVQQLMSGAKHKGCNLYNCSFSCISAQVTSRLRFDESCSTNRESFSDSSSLLCDWKCLSLARGMIFKLPDYFLFLQPALPLTTLDYWQHVPFFLFSISVSGFFFLTFSAACVNHHKSQKKVQVDLYQRLTGYS